MKFSSLCLCVSIFALGNLSYALDWGHVSELQSGGTTIQIDYQTPMAEGNTVASADVFINVHFSDGGGCNKGVAATLSSYCGGFPEGAIPVILPFQDDANGECRFSNTSPVEIPNATHAGLCQQQLGLTIDAIPLFDPISGTETFEFSMPFVN